MKPTPDAPDAPDAPRLDPLPEVASFEIAERRAKYGDLTMLREIDPSAALINQSEPMVTRWCYTGPGREGRYAELTGPFGYVPVYTYELLTAVQRHGWNASPEGIVTRGEKGYEVLVKMPRRLYEQIQFKRAEDNDTRRRSSHVLRQQVVDELAQKGQHQAAEAARGLRTTLFEETADVRKV